jgi:hypothetical protein
MAARSFVLTVDEKAALRKASTSSLPELLSSLLHQSKARVMDLFRALDKNGDGQVTRAELAKALKDLGVQASKSAMDELFSHLDPDHSGGIEFRELQRALMATARTDSKREPAAGSAPSEAPASSTPPTSSPPPPATVRQPNFRDMGKQAVLSGFTRGLREAAANDPKSSEVISQIVERLAAKMQMDHGKAVGRLADVAIHQRLVS